MKCEKNEVSADFVNKKVFMLQNQLISELNFVINSSVAETLCFAHITPQQPCPRHRKQQAIDSGCKLCSKGTTDPYLDFHQGHRSDYRPWDKLCRQFYTLALVDVPLNAMFLSANLTEVALARELFPPLVLIYCFGSKRQGVEYHGSLTCFGTLEIQVR